MIKVICIVGKKKQVKTFASDIQALGFLKRIHNEHKKADWFYLINKINSLRQALKGNRYFGYRRTEMEKKLERLERDRAAHLLQHKLSPPPLLRIEIINEDQYN